MKDNTLPVPQSERVEPTAQALETARLNSPGQTPFADPAHDGPAPNPTSTGTSPAMTGPASTSGSARSSGVMRWPSWIDSSRPVEARDLKIEVVSGYNERGTYAVSGQDKAPLSPHRSVQEGRARSGSQGTEGEGEILVYAHPQVGQRADREAHATPQVVRSICRAKKPSRS